MNGSYCIIYAIERTVHRNWSRMLSYSQRKCGKWFTSLGHFSARFVFIFFFLFVIFHFNLCSSLWNSSADCSISSKMQIWSSQKQADEAKKNEKWKNKNTQKSNAVSYIFVFIHTVLYYQRINVITINWQFAGILYPIYICTGICTGTATHTHCLGVLNFTCNSTSTSTSTHYT